MCVSSNMFCKFESKFHNDIDIFVAKDFDNLFIFLFIIDHTGLGTFSVHKT